MIMEAEARRTHSRHQTTAEARGRLAQADAKISYWENVVTTPEDREAVDQILEEERVEHDFWWRVIERIHG